MLFDASKVSQPVQVRLANNGEELVLLDGTTAKLQPNTFSYCRSNWSISNGGYLWWSKQVVLMLKQQEM